MNSKPAIRAPAARRRRKLAAVVAVVVGLVVCGAVWGLRGSSRRTPSQASAGKVNVLLISLDTTRRDHLSCYGYERSTTPKLDALARESLLFTRCIASSNWTVPSHASMLTGLYPATHGAHWVTKDVPHVDPNDPVGPLNGACETLAEVLARRGYRTGAVVANAYLSRSFELDQGFDYYDFRPGEFPAPYRHAGEITDEAIQWLRQRENQPFFLFLNYLDPHPPYNPPPPFNTRFRENAPPNEVRTWGMRFWSDARNAVLTNGDTLAPTTQALFHDRYDGEIAHADNEVGRLLDWLRTSGQYEPTLIVVTSDHGEAFGEHAVMGHSLSLYEPEVAVPLIVKLPFRRTPEIVRRLVGHADIMPTALEAVGAPIPAGVQGESLLHAAERVIVSEQYVCRRMASAWPRFDRSMRALYRGPFKYIEYSDGNYELFNIAEDAAELDNLSDRNPQQVQRLQQALRDWAQRTQPLPRRDGGAKPIPTDVEEQLKDLGYLQ